jgi:RND family efflux transporter, MFP subunit
MNKKIPLLIALCLMAALVGCGHQQSSKTKSGADRRSISAKMEAYVVKPILLNRTITVSGTIRPSEETVIMPEVTGRVVAINLPEGKAVKGGTLLVKLFDGDLQAQLKKARAQLEIAKQTQDRLAELVKVNGISRSDYDQAILQVNSLSADIDIIGVNIRKTEVLAPYSGVLGLRNISIGAQVAPQTPLVTIRAITSSNRFQRS